MEQVTKFFSNKYNIYGLLLLAYTLIGYIVLPELSTAQGLLVFFLIIFSNMAWYTMGMGKGITAGVIREYHHQLRKELKKKKK